MIKEIRSLASESATIILFESGVSWWIVQSGAPKCTLGLYKGTRCSFLKGGIVGYSDKDCCCTKYKSRKNPTKLISRRVLPQCLAANPGALELIEL